MRELLIDFITSLDGYASGEGWPGFWGLETPDYLAWLGEQPEVTHLMGATTYRLMSGFAAGDLPAGTDELRPDDDGYPDVALEMTGSRRFDGGIQLLEYRPRVLEHPPLGAGT